MVPQTQGSVGLCPSTEHGQNKPFLESSELMNGHSRKPLEFEEIKVLKDFFNYSSGAYSQE